MRRFLRHPLAAVAGAVAMTIPWMAVLLTGSKGSLANLEVVAVTGLAILGAAFLLAWAAESAEKDVPRAFAIAVLAILAVAPEYAVDALYAFDAGFLPGAAGAEAANLAVANMTGANRILIGIGWAGVAIYAMIAVRWGGRDPGVEERDGFLRDRIHLDPEISTEILFLLVATAYAFLVPIAGGIDVVDTVVLVGLYVAYIGFTLRSPPAEVENIGVPAYFHDGSRTLRVPFVLFAFIYAGVVLVSGVEPFAHNLEELGIALGVSKFLMIQWVAPLASETPELVVVVYLVNKARTTPAFNTLISSKLNQWTLLIGTLVVVLTVGQYLGGHPVTGVLPFDPKQAGEIWLTAAQSFFAIALIMDLTMSMREAILLLVLFLVQLYPAFHSYQALLGYSALYLILGGILFARRIDHLGSLYRNTRRRFREEAPSSGEELREAPPAES
jgi:cation:H+ antiporter